MSMLPANRDAIVRLSRTDEYPYLRNELRGLIKAQLSSLGCIDPSDTINIARTQGRIQGLEMIEALVEQAISEATKQAEDNA